MKNEIVLFEDEELKLEVNMKDDTVWLSLNQMVKLFDRDKSVISRHIKNIFEEGELDEKAVVAKNATTARDGKKYQVEYYDLDVIISVGYRVKSKRGIAFRRWANKVLKDYLLNGYVINNKRLEYLEKTIKLIDIANRADERLEESDAKNILKVIGDYSKAFNLLDDYDHKTLSLRRETVSDKMITYDECKNLINTLRFNNESDLFALERNKGLSSIINTLYQTYDGKDVYHSLEEKAANFLYLTVKNHVFIDGNKRIAATLFIYFLQSYNMLYKEDKKIIDNNTLAALTILIAESNPEEKDILINLVTNFLT